MLKLTKKILIEAVKYINEVKFNDIDIKKALSDFIKKDNHDMYYDEFDHLYGTDDNTRDESEFNNYVENRLNEKIEDIYWNIKDSITDNGKINIYRAMTVDERWLNNIKNPQRLGIYWTYEASAAEAHWADYNKKNTVVIHSEIDEKYVDWDTTIKNNLKDWSESEKEITLLKNTPLYIISLEVNGQSYYKDFKGIKYRA